MTSNAPDCQIEFEEEEEEDYWFQENNYMVNTDEWQAEEITLTERKYS